MNGYGLSRADLIRRGETMNSLKLKQQSLNMQLLMALQNHDCETQAELETQLEEVAAQIACMGQGGKPPGPSHPP